ncbi:MAG: DUF1080 domain-containing protein [Acidobacteria bacterium]|nr:DUF1080 domain-containing protein [Acidobacteriota bacterium]
MRALLRLAALTTLVAGAAVSQSFPLASTDSLEALNASLEAVTFEGRKGVKMTIDPAVAARLERTRAGAKRATKKAGPGAGEANRVEVLAFLEGVEFSSGTIELELAGQPSDAAGGGARGFAGLAFRVQQDPRVYDAFYLRPTNGRADDQERRNHSVQYIAHPDYPWYRLRQETPSKYEAYADISPAEWIAVKIEIDGAKARLFVNGATQPTLLVNDLKSGAEGKGRVALWIEGSTVAHFRNVRITPR